jgi:hypothetical protein
MMSEFFLQKRELVFQVYEKAKKSTTESSFSGISKNLELVLLEDFGIPLSYKTFETYYKILVENNEDYKIKTTILNDLSTYLGYADFKDFTGQNPIKNSKIKISIDGKESVKETKSFSDIIINITNSPVFTLPEFITKHSNSFVLIGIFLVSGFILKKGDFFSGEKEEKRIQEIDSVIVQKNNLSKLEPTPAQFVNVPKQILAIPEEKNLERKKECMYWNGEIYVEVFCGEKIEGAEVLGLNEEAKLLRKITRPDTLTEENSLGKVWYDKSNNHVEFFTHYGKHPENGKTLKEVTSHILEKYAKK